jgi:type IX secretion system PorP/SprF family membrane protein
MSKATNIFKMIAVFCIVIPLSGRSQQSMQFTQYMFNGLVINPAYAGADEALSVTLIHRSQWTGIENAPATQTLTAHTAIKEKKIGVGLLLVNDRIGVHQNFTAMNSYAYHIRVGKESYLSMGLQAGIKNIRSDYTSLVGNTNDPTALNAYTARTFFNFGTGIYFRSSRFHSGLSIPEVSTQRFYNSSSSAFRFYPSTVLIFAKYRITLNDYFDIEPSTLLKHLKDLPFSFDANLNVIYRGVLTIGLSYRTHESMDFILKAQASRQFQFGYAYDHAIGNAAQLSKGSHELMVQYIFRYVQKNMEAPR